MKYFRIELGTKVKSYISGFKGVVTCRSEHINGCDRYWVQPEISKDGNVPAGCWVDDPELIIVGKIKLPKDAVLRISEKKNSGGFPSQIK